MKRLPLAVAGVLMALLMGACASTAKLEMRQNQVNYHYRLGMAHLEDRNLQAALVEFYTANKVDDKSPKVLFAMGHTLFLQGEYAQAEQTMSQLVKYRPEDGKALNYLGTIYERQGRLKEAEQAFLKTLKMNDYLTPQFPHQNLARIYLSQGNREGAEKHLLIALRKVPEYSSARADLAKLYMDNGAWEKAADQWQAFIDVLPNMHEARYYLGRAYLGMHQPDNARKELQKFLLKIDPDSPLVAEARALLDDLNSTE